MASDDSGPVLEPNNEGSDSPSDESGEVYQYIEERFESTIEERPDGTSYRIVYTRNSSVRLGRRSLKRPRSKITARTLIFLFVFIVIVTIGLVAVGPEGVWEDLKDVLADL